MRRRCGPLLDTRPGHGSPSYRRGPPSYRRGPSPRWRGKPLYGTRLSIFPHIPPSRRRHHRLSPRGRMRREPGHRHRLRSRRHGIRPHPMINRAPCLPFRAHTRCLPRSRQRQHIRHWCGPGHCLIPAICKTILLLCGPSHLLPIACSQNPLAPQNEPIPGPSPKSKHHICQQDLPRPLPPPDRRSSEGPPYQCVNRSQRIPPDPLSKHFTSRIPESESPDYRKSDRRHQGQPTPCGQPRGSCPCPIRSSHECQACTDTSNEK
jgi:hypothetical protein